MDLHEAPEAYSRVIHYDTIKEVQVRLTINTFRGVEYMHLRKYYMDFDEEWKPTPEGIALPLDLSNSRELFIGLVEILSLAESKEIIQEHFSDLIQELYIEETHYLRPSFFSIEAKGTTLDTLEGFNKRYESVSQQKKSIVSSLSTARFFFS